MSDDLEKALGFIRDEIEISGTYAEDPDDDQVVKNYRRVEVLLMSITRLRAQVAAAYEDSRDTVITTPSNYAAPTARIELANAIGKKTPADASAALDALLHQARIEGAKAMHQEVGRIINSGLGLPGYRVQQNIMASDPEQVVKTND